MKIYFYDQSQDKCIANVNTLIMEVIGNGKISLINVIMPSMSDVQASFTAPKMGLSFSFTNVFISIGVVYSKKLAGLKLVAI